PHQGGGGSADRRAPVWARLETAAAPRRRRCRRREPLDDDLLDVTRDNDRGTGGVDAHEAARMLGRELLERSLDGRVKRLGSDLEAIQRQLLSPLPLRGGCRRNGEVQGEIGPDVAACGCVEPEQIPSWNASTAALVGDRRIRVAIG